ncbi:hypothetical protein APS_1223 [Acetobacter pasteurianus subsp. pasteurianus LMG 1262 = NBRC 106471]|nr:hypothetical protein APS_1223 [Acetobacter pasteurianus subsp. pasteurianus LMG 1262 = NBRC 106471]
MIARPAAFFCTLQNIDTHPKQKPTAMVSRLSARHTEQGASQR